MAATSDTSCTQLQLYGQTKVRTRIQVGLRVSNRMVRAKCCHDRDRPARVANSGKSTAV